MIDAIKIDEYSRHRFVLWFGACAPTRVLVSASSLEDALEDAAQILRDNKWNGLFTEPDYEDAYQDLLGGPWVMGKGTPWEQEFGWPILRDAGWQNLATCDCQRECECGHARHVWPQRKCAEPCDCHEYVSRCSVPGHLCMRVMEQAEADLTYTESGYIASWEWGIVAEDPSRDELLAIAHEECVWPGKVFSDGSVWTREREHKHGRAS